MLPFTPHPCKSLWFLRAAYCAKYTKWVCTRLYGGQEAWSSWMQESGQPTCVFWCPELPSPSRSHSLDNACWVGSTNGNAQVMITKWKLFRRQRGQWKLTWKMEERLILCIGRTESIWFFIGWVRYVFLEVFISPFQGLSTIVANHGWIWQRRLCSVVMEDNIEAHLETPF
jgi:hypothetical protein